MEFTLLKNKNNALRLGIIGLGKMGMLHLAAYNTFPQVSITAIVDIDKDKEKIAKIHNIPFYLQPEEVTEYIDAAIIATNTTGHVTSALPLLKAGIPCLIEKPLGSNYTEAKHLFLEAKKNQCLIFVGQSERFNPGVQAAQLAINDDITHIKIIRTVSGLRFCPSTDVLYDLMIHDLDWLIYSLGIPLNINIIDTSFIENRLEYIVCELIFSRRLKATLEARRFALSRQRSITLCGNNIEKVYYLDELLKCSTTPDPLIQQARAFLNRLQNKESIIATGEEGLQVMTCINQIRQHINHHANHREPMTYSRSN